MDSPRIDGKGHQCILCKLREDLLGPGLINPIHGASQIVVAETFRFDVGSQEQCRVFILEKLGQPVKRRSPGQGVENHGEDHHAWIHFHLCVDHLVDDFNQTDFSGIGFDDRQMPDIGDDHVFTGKRRHRPPLLFVFVLKVGAVYQQLFEMSRYFLITKNTICYGML